MRKIRPNGSLFNTGLPLLDWAKRQTVFRRTSARRRLERLYGLPPTLSEVVAPLAGLGTREDR